MKEGQDPGAEGQGNNGRIRKDQAPDTVLPIKDPTRIRSSGEETAPNRMISTFSGSFQIGFKGIRALPRSY